MLQRISGFLFLCLVAVVPSASAQTESTVPAVEAIVKRMAQARAENRHRFRPYIVTRDYQLFGKEKQETKSQVIVDVAFTPPDFKKYVFQQTRGVGLGTKIVRRMLESEVEIAKDFGSTDISPDNYDFRFIHEENIGGQRSYVLELHPRRKDKNLVRGNIWVDVDVGGMWLQTASEATATVRILGQHTMVARDVKYSISELVAAGSSGRRGFYGIRLTDLFGTVKLD